MTLVSDKKSMLLCLSMLCIAQVTLFNLTNETWVLCIFCLQCFFLAGALNLVYIFNYKYTDPTFLALANEFNYSTGLICSSFSPFIAKMSGEKVLAYNCCMLVVGIITTLTLEERDYETVIKKTDTSIEQSGFAIY